MINYDILSLLPGDKLSLVCVDSVSRICLNYEFDGLHIIFKNAPDSFTDFKVNLLDVPLDGD